MKCKAYAILAAAFLVLTAYSPAPACNVCHSKNPGMVNMHRALGFSDCFKCHGPAQKRSPQDRTTQMSSDPLCVDCHKK